LTGCLVRLRGVFYIALESLKEAENLRTILIEVPSTLTFMIQYAILRSVPRGTTQEVEDLGTRLMSLALVYSERRSYETNEETSTPFRDGISD